MAKFFKMPNDMVEALARLEISSPALRVLLIILRNTVGWNRDQTTITQRQIAKATGLPRRSVRRGLDELASSRIVEMKVGHGCVPSQIKLNDLNGPHTAQSIGPHTAHKRAENGPIEGHIRPNLPINRNTKERHFLKTAEKKLPNLNPDLWEKFISFRSKIGKPVTEETVEAVIEQIIWATDGYPQVAHKVLNICMANGWAMVTQKIEPPSVEEKYPEMFSDNQTRI